MATIGCLLAHADFVRLFNVSFRFVKRFTYRPVRTKTAEIVLGQHKVVDLYALFTGGYDLKSACNKAAVSEPTA